MRCIPTPRTAPSRKRKIDGGGGRWQNRRLGQRGTRCSRLRRLARRNATTNGRSISSFPKMSNSPGSNSSPYRAAPARWVARPRGRRPETEAERVEPRRQCRGPPVLPKWSTEARRAIVDRHAELRGRRQLMRRQTLQDAEVRAPACRDAHIAPSNAFRRTPARWRAFVDRARCSDGAASLAPRASRHPFRRRPYPLPPPRRATPPAFHVPAPRRTRRALLIVAPLPLSNTYPERSHRSPHFYRLALLR